MDRVYNFSAGPSTLPIVVLKKASTELLNYKNSGHSVMEMSHRSKIFKEILEETLSLIRIILEVPKNYKILLLQGGGSSQFSMVPLNLMNKNNTADYIITGQWSKNAYLEAKRYGKVNIIASSEDKMFSYIPKVKMKNFSKNSDYIHICLNNTIYGTKFYSLPSPPNNIPVVADVSSCILSEYINISKFGLLYACAQKNMGIAGTTIVIIRDDLIGNAMNITPTMFNYKIHADTNSTYNTPPCYAIYICKLVLEWLKNDMGGLKNIQKINKEKSSLLYNFLDNSKLFKGTAVKEDRSITNIPFTTNNEILNKKFVQQAKENNIININGHRSIGGMRASIYNAMPLEGVEYLINFMRKFESKEI